MERVYIWGMTESDKDGQLVLGIIRPLEANVEYPKWRRDTIVVASVLLGGYLAHLWHAQYLSKPEYGLNLATACISGIAASILYDNFHRIKGLFSRVASSSMYIC